MPSILPKYEYDIFISYRQNDNRRDGWVTNFVAALKDELEATLKNPVSIYFDENPHDGLLETHQVNASLEKKLRCIILIPIISQTYCDTTSFAWEHEFLPFNKMAREDELGMNITLANGNVASRVLPIKIHDLDSQDQAMLEKELTGPLRSIDFIYKEPGVNRPLNPSDDRSLNLAKTDYHNQINKVANALKEMGNSIVNKETSSGSNPVKTQYGSATSEKKRRNYSKLLATFILIPLVLALLYFFWPTQAETNTAENQVEKSIAVLPFVNMSDDPAQEYFSNGVMEEILTHLYKIGDLQVTSRTSVMGYKGTTKKVTEIGKELNVSYILEGSVQKFGNKVRIIVQLIDASNDQNVWAERYDRDLKDVFAIQSEVAKQIASSLKANISPELKQRIESNPTSNTDAYDLFLKGREQTVLYYSKWELSYIYKGIDYLNRAIALDSNYANAYEGLARAYWVLGQFSPNTGPKFWEDAKKFALKAIELDPNNGLAYIELANVQYKWEWDKEAAYQSYQNAIRLEPGNVDIRSNALTFYYRSSNCTDLKKELEVIRSMTEGKGATGDYFLALCFDRPDLMKSVEPAGSRKAMILMHQGKYKEAIEFLEEQKKTNPYNIEYRAALGEAYAVIGDKAMAKQTIKEINDLSRARYISKCHIAPIYLAMGDEQKAYQLLEQALDENDFYLRFIMEFYVSIYRAKNDPRMVSIVERSWVPRKVEN